MNRPPEHSSMLENLAVVAIIVIICASSVFGIIAVLDGTITLHTPTHNIDR